MARHRTALPDPLKELVVLIRQGRLFAVQNWIQEGKPYRMPTEGDYAISPLRAAMGSGFHSMIEFLLPYCREDEDLDYLLSRAVESRRLDLIELLYKHGANPKSQDLYSVSSTGNPLILRWFEERELDLTTDHALANAFKYKMRGVLGTYMRMKEARPELKYQAEMALRYHARHGSMRWVSLLLWAGADPRQEVEDMESTPAEDFMGTALGDAVEWGQLEVVKKIGIDPKRDNLSKLLAESSIGKNKQIVEWLLSLGANPNEGGDSSAVSQYISSLEFALDETLPWRHDSDSVVAVLCLIASKGGRWAPTDSYRYSCLRRALSRCEVYKALDVLVKLVESGLIDQHVFHELMRTPKMQSILNDPYHGKKMLKQFYVKPASSMAGKPAPKRRARRMINEYIQPKN